MKAPEYVERIEALEASQTAQDAALRSRQGYDAVAVSTISSVIIQACKELLAKSRA